MLTHLNIIDLAQAIHFPLNVKTFPQDFLSYPWFMNRTAWTCLSCFVVNPRGSGVRQPTTGFSFDTM